MKVIPKNLIRIILDSGEYSYYPFDSVLIMRKECHSFASSFC